VAEGTVNLEEIARLAGVSRSTVSRVVNGDHRVSEEARQRVQTVIAATNYHPNAAARSLASRRTRMLGLLIPQGVGSIFNDPFFPRLIQGTVEACNDLDHNLTLLMDTSEDPSRADRLYQRAIRGRYLDGVVISSAIVDDPIVDRLQEAGVPYVLIGRHPRREVNFVDLDNRAAAKEAVAHLISHGYRRIGMISGSPNLIASIDRYAGYINALQEAGRLADPAVAIHSDFTRRGGYRSMKELLSARGGPPDAVFVASDTMASGALQALRDSGVSVPDDMAIMGFDGLEESTVSRPILSTVAQPIPDLGRYAVNALVELIDHPERAPLQTLLPTHLVLRRSCGCEADPAAVIIQQQGGVATN
jgi:LacI family transcriptional regulator